MNVNDVALFMSRNSSPCFERNDLYVDHQEYEKSEDLYWMLGWTAYVFETRIQMETKPEKQPEWTEAIPSQSHSHELEFELIPRIQLSEQQVSMLEQSENKRGLDPLHYLYMGMYLPP